MIDLQLIDFMREELSHTPNFTGICTIEYFGKIVWLVSLGPEGWVSQQW